MHGYFYPYYLISGEGDHKMSRVNKNQMAGKRGVSASAWYLPDKDCLPRFNYSNGAGWRTKKEGRIKWGVKHKR